jgi:hypothetical protein
MEMLVSLAPLDKFGTLKLYVVTVLRIVSGMAMPVLPVLPPKFGTFKL